MRRAAPDLDPDPDDAPKPLSVAELRGLVHVAAEVEASIPSPDLPVRIVDQLVARRLIYTTQVGQEVVAVLTTAGQRLLRP